MVGFAVCCNGQKQVGIVDWSVDTDWGYNNKLASKKRTTVKEIHYLQVSRRQTSKCKNNRMIKERCKTY